jgi:hypothetical protein
MVGSGLSTSCDVERLEEEKKTARAERNPLHVAKPETVGAEPLVISFTRIKHRGG